MRPGPDADDTAAVLAEIMAGNASEIQIAGFLIALRTKGETVEELAGLARTMRALAAPVSRLERRTCSTPRGPAAGRRTFNVSTTAALIAAGAGCTVAKHGNRSATGLSGSADVLEALGARIDLSPDAVARCIDEVGFGFMFAPAHHQATRYVIPVRRQLAVRTIFNFLGPLTNPAGATRQLIGVSDAAYLETMAGALALLGTEHALLVAERGRPRRAEHLGADAGRRGDRRGPARATRCRPRRSGLARAAADEVPGGTPEQNAQTARAIFAGERGRAPRARASSTPAPRSTPAAAPARSRRASRAARAAIDGGAAPRRSSASCGTRSCAMSTRQTNARGRTPNRLDPILVATREEVARRRRRCRRRRCRRRRPGGPSSRSGARLPRRAAPRPACR